MHDNESDEPDDDEQDDVENFEERERDADDGLTYADPRDEQEERRKALNARFDMLAEFVTGPRPEEPDGQL